MEHHHEIDATTCTIPGCGCTLKRIGQDVSERLDYSLGVFIVERHIRGMGLCPMPERDAGAGTGPDH